VLEAARPERSGSWSLRAPDGAYSTIPAWNTGAKWFDALMDALATTAGDELRRTFKVAAGTLLRVARADWLSADVNTGRGVATAHETVALELGMSAKTVQRSRHLLEALGFAVTVSEGRYLTSDERESARLQHGGRQIKAASLRALTVPESSRPVKNVHLPLRGGLKSTPHVLKNSSTRADARSKAAARPKTPSRTGVNPIQKPVQSQRSPRSLDLQQLAGGLRAQLRWLDDGRHVGALCDALVTVGVEPRRWTANDLVRTINRFTEERHFTFPTRIANPVGLLRWLLTKAIDPAMPTPAEERELIAIERRERIARQAAERQAEADRRAAIDWDDVQRIIDKSNREIADRQRDKNRAKVS